VLLIVLCHLFVLNEQPIFCSDPEFNKISYLIFSNSESVEVELITGDFLKLHVEPLQQLLDFLNVFMYQNVGAADAILKVKFILIEGIL
jgi:hypothetical protein